MTIQTQSVTTSIKIEDSIKHIGQNTNVCETLYATSTSSVVTKALIVATIALTSTAHLYPFMKAVGTANFTGTLSSKNHSSTSVQGVMNLSSTVVQETLVKVAEHINLSSVPTIKVKHLIADQLNLAETYTPKARRLQSFSDVLNLSIVPITGQFYSIAESLALHTATTILNKGYLHVPTQAAFTSSILAGKYKNTEVESLRLVSNYTTRVHTSPAVHETLTLSDGTTYPVTYVGWWMNSATTAMTHFDNLPFTSMAVIKGRIFGMGDQGLFEMTGDSDSGTDIAAYATSGYGTLGVPQKKRIPDVFVTGWCESPMTMTVSVDGTNAGDYGYTIPQRDINAPRGNRVTLAKGLNSTYWKFSLSNQNGGDFAIDSIDADISPSTNRRV